MIGTATIGPPIAANPDNPKSPDKLVPAAPRVRTLLPLFAKEPLRLRLRARLPAGATSDAVHATWNGVPLTPATAKVAAGTIAFDVPAALVTTRSRVNDVVFDLPPGTLLQRLDLDSTDPWWR